MALLALMSAVSCGTSKVKVDDTAGVGEIAESRIDGAGSDICEPDLGGCIHEPVECPEGQACDDWGGCTACAPDCDGKECGPDGCAGSCGECEEGCKCVGGKCAGCGGKVGFGEPCGEDKDCETGLCFELDGWAFCSELCQHDEDCSMESWCMHVDDERGDMIQVCVPCMGECFDKECGSDGCGGSCGGCPDGFLCTGAGLCMCDCTPQCEGKQCGPDMCLGTCGPCGEVEVCYEGSCCTPDCAGRNCGPTDLSST